MSEYTRELTSQSELQDLMEEGAEKTAIIDFWAPWCGPCKMMAPHFETAAEEMADEPVEFIKINTQNHPELSAPFHVQSIPTLVLVHDGEIIDTMIGAQDATRLQKKAKWLLSKARGEGFFKRLFG